MALYIISVCITQKSIIMSLQLNPILSCYISFLIFTTCLRSILISPPILFRGIPSCVYLWGFPTMILHIIPYLYLCVLYFSLDFIRVTVIDNWYKLWNTLLCNFLQSFVLHLCKVCIFLTTLFPIILSSLLFSEWETEWMIDIHSAVGYIPSQGIYLWYFSSVCLPVSKDINKWLKTFKESFCSLFCELFCKVLCFFRLQDIALFRSLSVNDKYKADPIASVSSHIHSKVYKECNK